MIGSMTARTRHLLAAFWRFTMGPWLHGQGVITIRHWSFKFWSAN
jgi:hypothetical protein